MELEQIVCRINVLSETSCEGKIELGGLLIDAKSKVKHGTWKKWLDENTDFSQSKANKLMKVYEFVNSLKSSTCTNLEVRKLFALTSLKDEIDVEFFMENYDLENMSVREIEKEVKLYNKQLKQDEMEQLKAQKEIVEVKSTEEEIPTYTKIHTEIKVDNVSYYPLDEVCGVMNKTLNDFRGKYSNLVVSIKGNDCIKFSDFLKVSAEENQKCEDIDLDNNFIELTVEKVEDSALTGSIFITYYIIDKNKKLRIPFVTYDDKLTTNGAIDRKKVIAEVTEIFNKHKGYDKKAIQFATILILEHLEIIKETIINKQKQKEYFNNAYKSTFNNNNKNQIATLDKNEYRKLAKVCHPDAGGSEELMNIISKLYNKAA